MFFILIGVALIVASIVVSHIRKYSDIWLLPFVLGFIVLFLSILLGIAKFATKDYTAGALREEYKSLIYQAKSKLYLKENQIGLKELANQIQDWNEKLAGRRSGKESLWTNIFYPIDYSEFDYIDMSILNGGT